MQKSQQVTASTVLDELETRELIERMTHERQTTVQDVAEAMDVDVEVVVTRLAQMRADKKAEPTSSTIVAPSKQSTSLRRKWLLSKRAKTFTLLTGILLLAAVVVSKNPPHGPLPARIGNTVEVPTMSRADHDGP